MAVLPDSAEAVRITNAAGELALATGRPLALIVPVVAARATLDPVELAREQARISQDTAAIAARVRPTLARLGLPNRVFPAPYRADMPSGEMHRGMAAAVEALTSRLAAETVFVSADSTALVHLRIPAGSLRSVEPASGTPRPQPYTSVGSTPSAPG